MFSLFHMEEQRDSVISYDRVKQKLTFRTYKKLLQQI